MNEIIKNYIYTNLEKAKKILLGSLFKNSALTFIYKIVGLILGYIFTVLIAQKFNASILGIFTLMLTILQISTVVTRVGLDTAVMKLISAFESQSNYAGIKEVYNKSITILFITSLTSSLFMAAFSGIIAELIFDKSYLKEFIASTALFIIPVTFFYFHTEALRGLHFIRSYAFLQHLSPMLLAIIIFFISFFILGADEYIPLYAYGSSFVILSLVSFVIWMKKSGIGSIVDTVNNYTFKSLIQFSSPFFFSNSLALIMGWIDVLMLAVFCSDSEVGIYIVALKISTLAGIVLLAVNAVVAPKFSALHAQNDLIKLKEVAQSSTKLIFWFTVPIIFIVIYFSHNIFSLFGSEFIIAQTTLYLLFLGAFFSAISGSVGFILQMSGHQKKFQNIMLLSISVNILLNYFLIPRYGMEGAAIATSVSKIIWNAIALYYVYKYLKFINIYLPFKHILGRVQWKKI